MRTRGLVFAAAVVLIAVIPAAATTEPAPPCYGDPPRQTEDPLSPPCVSFFEGDNGGATAPGVTADEITLALYNDDGIAGDLSEPWDPSDEAGLPGPGSSYRVRTLKALARYFVQRMQTYGRLPRIIAVPASGSSCDARAADAASVIDEIDPFATLALTHASVACYSDVMTTAQRGTFTFNAPYTGEQLAGSGAVWSFAPDTTLQADLSAGFLCRKVIGRKAAFAGDTWMRTSTRRTALVVPGDIRTDLFARASALSGSLRTQCDASFDVVQPFDDRLLGLAGGPAVIASLKARNVTTVVCYCVDGPEDAQALASLHTSASAINYHPEWYWDGAMGMDRGTWTDIFSDPLQPSFGSAWIWRMPGLGERYPNRAYAAEEPGTIPNERIVMPAYYAMLTTFNAIQAAGPNLTLGTVDRGLATMSYLKLDDPWLPSGSFGTGGPSRFSFVDTGIGWWWDPRGTPPDGRTGEGCIRVLRLGRRFYAETWPLGNRGLYRDDSPCTSAPFPDLRADGV